MFKLGYISEQENGGEKDHTQRFLSGKSSQRWVTGKKNN